MPLGTLGCPFPQMCPLTHAHADAKACTRTQRAYTHATQRLKDETGGSHLHETVAVVHAIGVEFTAAQDVAGIVLGQQDLFLGLQQSQGHAVQDLCPLKQQRVPHPSSRLQGANTNSVLCTLEVTGHNDR
jgi:hypothetical protein